MSTADSLTPEGAFAALERVLDPEIRRPITELGMVGDIAIDDGAATVQIKLTVAACPLRDTLVKDVTAALTKAGATSVAVDMTVMTPEERQGLRERLRGSTPDIPFNRPDSLTRIYAVCSGKGGVGKSTVTANLAAAMAARGLAVGVVDADVHGFSIPRMLGAGGGPTQVDDMILPVVANGVKCISMGMLVEEGRPVVWRGPMLHRALQQFLTDVFWGDLDVLLLDLPPGTGDMAISVAQLLPNARLVVVTTPQPAAAEVAQRAGAMALQTKQRIAGVIENMSWLTQPDGERLELFGAGGGAALAQNLAASLGQDVPLLGQLPLDVRLRECGDEGTPVVLAQPDSPAAIELAHVAEVLMAPDSTLVGRRLSVNPV